MLWTTAWHWLNYWSIREEWSDDSLFRMMICAKFPRNPSQHARGVTEKAQVKANRCTDGTQQTPNHWWFIRMNAFNYFLNHYSKVVHHWKDLIWILIFVANQHRPCFRVNKSNFWWIVSLPVANGNLLLPLCWLWCHWPMAGEALFHTLLL